MPHIDIETVLRPVPRCPTCGSAERRRNEQPVQHVSPYTKVMAQSVGLAPEALLQRVPLWDCPKCGTAWRDPWLTDAFAETLYGYVCGTHYYGWMSLGMWLEEKPSPVLAAREAVRAHLRAHHRGPMSYAELNCPNSGLAFAELDAQGREQNRQLGRRRFKDLRRVYGEAGLPERAHALFIDGERRAAVEAERGFLVRRTLLTEDSPLCWRRSCIYRGVGCHAFAQGVLFDRMVPLVAAEASGERFDLIGVMQILDHLPDPLGAMRRLLKLGARVLLEMHAPGWTDMQHLYGLGHGFPALLAAEGVHVRDLTAVAYGRDAPETVGSLFFIFSVEDDLGWLPSDPPA